MLLTPVDCTILTEQHKSTFTYEWKSPYRSTFTYEWEGFYWYATSLYNQYNGKQNIKRQLFIRSIELCLESSIEQ